MASVILAPSMKLMMLLLLQSVGCMTTPKHCHFGAGKLGLGLVVPAIAGSGIPFAVIQRSTKEWALTHSNIGLSINGDAVRDDAGEPVVLETGNSLIIGTEADELRNVVKGAASFSCSLGPAMAAVVVPTLTEALPVRELSEQPILFACENDEDEVNQLKTALAGRARVVKCMVDRVCTERTIGADGRVHVKAEPWGGSIVTLEPNLPQVPFAADVVRVPSSHLEARYLGQRKLSLVNGMHTVLAFMTLQAHFVPHDDDLEGHLLENDQVLLKYAHMTRAQQRTVEAWRTARAYMLLREFGVAHVMEWHGLSSREEAWEELLAHADHILNERFSKVDDVVSRVLGGGVANRWNTRLRPVAKSIAADDKEAAAAEEGSIEPNEMAPGFFCFLANLVAGGADETDGACDGDALEGFFQYSANRDRERATARISEACSTVYPTEVEPLAQSEREAREAVRRECSMLCMQSRHLCSAELEPEITLKL